MRCLLLLLAFASILLRGQDQPGVSPVEPNHSTPAQPAPKLLDWRFLNSQPDWTGHMQLFTWQPANAKPNDIEFLEAPSRPSTCAVPLLPVPLDPNPDPNMPVLHPPKSPIENAEIVKGVPPCPKDRLK